MLLMSATRAIALNVHLYACNSCKGVVAVAHPLLSFLVEYSPRVCFPQEISKSAKLFLNFTIFHPLQLPLSIAAVVLDSGSFDSSKAKTVEKKKRTFFTFEEASLCIYCLGGLQ